MPQQGYSIGRDVSLVVILPGGTSLRMRKVTGWEAKPDTADEKILGLDGDTDNLRFYQGWSGSFQIERRGPELDQYFATLEANFFAGRDEPPVTIQQTITEPDGSVSQFRFEKVILKYDDAGKWTGDKSVPQTVSFMAGRRVKQA